MFVIGNLFIAVARILDILFYFYWWVMLIRVLLSWVNPDPFNPVVRFLHQATDPVLRPIRQRLPNMAVDISPIIAFMIIIFIQTFLIASLRDLGYAMRQSKSEFSIQSNQYPTKRSTSAQSDNLF